MKQWKKQEKNLIKLLKAKYKNASFVWAQEEPRNMGALSFLMLNTNELFSNYIARPASAATATGFSKQHAKEQQSIVDAVFADSK